MMPLTKEAWDKPYINLLVITHYFPNQRCPYTSPKKLRLGKWFIISIVPSLLKVIIHDDNSIK